MILIENDRFCGFALLLLEKKGLLGFKLLKYYFCLFALLLLFFVFVFLFVFCML